MPNLRISELTELLSPDGSEYMEVIITPFSPGTNRKVLISAIIALAEVEAGDTLDLVTVVTTGGTITLDLGDEKQRMFVGSASFAGPKTIALSNDGDGLVINMVFNLTNVAAVLTFPSSFTMQNTDSRWSDGAHTFSPQSTGVYEFSATFDGTDWHLKATSPYS